MGSNRVAASGLLILLVSAPLAAQQNDVTFEERRVSLTFHPGALPPELARRLADESWAVVQQAMAGLKDLGVVPKEAMHVEVHGATGPYLDARRATGERLRVDEFAVAKEQRAHVLMQTMVTEEMLAVVGLPPATREALIRQLGWLAASQSDVGARDPWICQVMGAGLLDAIQHPSYAAGVNARFDSRRVHFAGEHWNGVNVKLAQWLEWTLPPSTQEQWELYWESAGRTAQLLAAKSRSWPKKLLRVSGKLRKERDLVAVRTAIIMGMLGKSWERIEPQLQEQLREGAPRWTMTQPLVDFRDGRVVMAGSVQRAAALCLFGGAPTDSYVLRGEYELVAAGGRRWRIEFSDDSGMAFCVKFHADFVELARWQGGKYHGIARHAYESERLTPVAFAVTVGEQVVVAIDDVDVLQTPAAEHPLHAKLIMVANDSVVRLRDLQVTAE